jgi:hypothetical protein
MGFYNRFILPQVIELALRPKYFWPFRERAAGAARGRVLEVGIGSGLNLTSYSSGVESVDGIDPSRALLAMAAKRVNTGVGSESVPGFRNLICAICALTNPFSATSDTEPRGAAQSWALGALAP